MNSYRDFFALSVVCAAAFTLYLLVHLLGLLTTSHMAFGSDHLPKHILITSAAPMEHHVPGVQSSNTLAKPLN